MNDQIVEGDDDPSPYKVDRVTQAGEFLSRIAEYATEEEAMAHKRRLDWRYRIHARRKTIWPTKTET